MNSGGAALFCLASVTIGLKPSRQTSSAAQEIARIILRNSFLRHILETSLMQITELSKPTLVLK
jgi:hypothetical protein